MMIRFSPRLFVFTFPAARMPFRANFAASSSKTWGPSRGSLK